MLLFRVYDNPVEQRSSTSACRRTLNPIFFSILSQLSFSIYNHVVRNLIGLTRKISQVYNVHFEVHSGGQQLWQLQDQVKGVFK